MIRNASLADLGTLLVLAEQMHAESPRFSVRRFSVDKTAELFRRLIERDDGLVLVAERDGELIGAFVGYTTEDWFGPDIVAGDFGLYVAPRHRGGAHAALLIQGYVEWARSRGVAHPEIGISTGVHVEKTTRLYEAQGFVTVGPIMAHQGN